MVESELLNLMLLGLRNTLLVVSISAPAGLSLGLAMGMARIYAPRTIAWFLDSLSNLVRGVPLLALLYILVYGLTDLGLVMDPLYASVIAFTVCSSAYISEYVKTSIMSIAMSEIEAARSLGMMRLQELRYIILPKLRSIATPSILNELVYLVQYSTLAGLVGVYEVYSAVRTYISKYFDVWIPFASLSAIYVAFAIVVEIFNKIVSYSRTLQDKYAHRENL